MAKSLKSHKQAGAPVSHSAPFFVLWPVFTLAHIICPRALESYGKAFTWPIGKMGHQWDTGAPHLFSYSGANGLMSQ